MGSPMEMNGGSVIAMTGKDCVAIASDLRLGQQAVGLTADFEKVGAGEALRLRFGPVVSGLCVDLL
jgi:hypothetical protein